RTLWNETTCESRPPVCRNSTVKFGVKNASYKLKKIRRILLVGAPRFELGTSCAQGRRATRLRYAPTVTALLILRQFPSLLLISLVSVRPIVPRAFSESGPRRNPETSQWLGGSFSSKPRSSAAISCVNVS